MNAVDVKCPICETLNKSLNLEETDGWMECENCGNVVQILKYVMQPLVRLLTLV
jgi:uncharacterized Zn finger protein